jgi:hypothetical protein
MAHQYKRDDSFVISNKQLIKTLSDCTFVFTCFGLNLCVCLRESQTNNSLPLLLVTIYRILILNYQYFLLKVIAVLN